MAVWMGPKSALKFEMLPAVPVKVTYLLLPEPVVPTVTLSATASVNIKEARNAASSSAGVDGAASVPVSVVFRLLFPVRQKNNEFGETVLVVVSVSVPGYGPSGILTPPVGV
jgi:hypothetical protein